jgi:hypothetical protein
MNLFKNYLLEIQEENISLSSFDLKFLKSIKDWKNIGYAPEKWPGKYYTIMYNNKKAGIVGFITMKGIYFFQIAIHEKFRGLDLLKKSADLLVKKHNIKKFYATIWLDNKASYLAHIKAGFKEINSSEKNKLIKAGLLEEGSTRLYKNF